MSSSFEYVWKKIHYTPSHICNGKTSIRFIRYISRDLLNKRGSTAVCGTVRYDLSHLENSTARLILSFGLRRR